MKTLGLLILLVSAASAPTEKKEAGYAFG